MTVFLVRHGESTGNLAAVFSGTLDHPLTEAGRRQAGGVGAALSGRHFAAVFTSLLSRAIETAAIALAEGGCRHDRLIRSERLNERCFGVLEGAEQVPTLDPAPDEPAFLTRTDANYRPVQGESLRDTFFRVTAYFDEVIAPSAAEGDVLVVAHGNVNKCLAVAWLGWPIKLIPELPMRNGLITRLELPPGAVPGALSRPEGSA